MLDSERRQEAELVEVLVAELLEEEPELEVVEVLLLLELLLEPLLELLLVLRTTWLLGRLDRCVLLILG